LLERTGLDLADRPSREELPEAGGGSSDPHESRGRLVDRLFSKRVEPELIQPSFLRDYLVELSPFAEARRSEPEMVER
jgi:lysyl-tRNA synthetase, class II